MKNNHNLPQCYDLSFIEAFLDSPLIAVLDLLGDFSSISVCSRFICSTWLTIQDSYVFLLKWLYIPISPES